MNGDSRVGGALAPRGCGIRVRVRERKLRGFDSRADSPGAGPVNESPTRGGPPAGLAGEARDDGAFAGFVAQIAQRVRGLRARRGMNQVRRVPTKRSL